MMNPEEKLLNAVFEPEKLIEKELTKLKEDYELLIKPELQRTKTLREEVKILKARIKELQNCCKMVIPNKVYTHKERKNTTVKFLDGSQVTVTRKAGEKDCIETAIAYCIMKQLLSAKDLKKLIEEREEH